MRTDTAKDTPYYKATDGITVMLVPHSEKHIFKLKINLRLLRFIMIISFLSIVTGIVTLIVLNRSELTRQQVYDSATSWQVRLGLIDYYLSEIDSYAGYYNDAGRRMYKKIWQREYVDKDYPDTVTGRFEKDMAPMMKASEFFALRESEYRNMPVGMPLTSAYVTSLYGERVSPFGMTRQFHTGIDFASAVGSPIYAPADGEVVYSGGSGGYGLHVKILHRHGFVSMFAHCSALYVEKGDKVKRGDHIANLGATGNVTGPHLHYEIRLRNPDPFRPYEITLNPWPFVRAKL